MLQSAGRSPRSFRQRGGGHCAETQASGGQTGPENNCGSCECCQKLGGWTGLLPSGHPPPHPPGSFSPAATSYRKCPLLKVGERWSAPQISSMRAAGVAETARAGISRGRAEFPEMRHHGGTAAVPLPTACGASWTSRRGRGRTGAADNSSSCAAGAARRRRRRRAQGTARPGGGAAGDRRGRPRPLDHGRLGSAGSMWPCGGRVPRSTARAARRGGNGNALTLCPPAAGQLPDMYCVRRLHELV